MRLGVAFMVLTWHVSGLTHSATAYDLRAQEATTHDATLVHLTYEVTGTPVPMGSVAVQVWRSTDAVLHPEVDTLLAAVTLADLSAGIHTQEIPVPPGSLGLQASHPFILVALDPVSEAQPQGDVSEENEANNITQFRKVTLAVIVHGLTFFDAPPEWEALLAETLRGLNYDDVLEADWAQLSRQVRPGAPQQFAEELLVTLMERIDALETGDNDRVDLHWIGHSRGAVVVSEALRMFPSKMEQPAILRGGWQKVTLLDPHPAVNRDPEQISINTFFPLGALVGQGTRLFQGIARDPDVVIPTDFVDDAENYYQRNEWYALSPTEVFFDYLTNYWGETNLAGVPLNQSYDITEPRLSHFEVPNYYIDRVLLPAQTVPAEQAVPTTRRAARGR